MKRPIVRKKYLKLHIETARQRVLELLIRYPEKEFSLSDLAKEAGVAKSNIGMIIDDLYKNELIAVEKLAKIWRIKANQGGWKFIRTKIIYNLHSIYQSGVVEFLAEFYKNPKTIVLFGSFRKGEDISSSDIDIAIEMDEIDDYKTTGLRELLDFEEELGKKIQIHLFNRKSVDINVFNNVANGIVVYGFLEVRP